MSSEMPEHGYRIVGTIKSIKGQCSAGHKVGDKFELSCYSSAGLCGFFYHDLFPWISVLQYGGSYPWYEDKDVVELECIDKYNAVTIELRRIR